MSFYQPLKHQGVTLIELVVVILILSILAITAAPKFIGINSFDAFTYRDQMISSLRLIQQQAMQQTDQNSCHQIIINTDSYGQSSDCTTPTLISDWQNLATGFAIPSDSNVELTGSVTLTFDSWGRAIECTSQCSVIFSNPVSGDNAVLCVEEQGYIHAC